MAPIYMDNHATTRVDPRVLEAMLPYFSPEFELNSQRGPRGRRVPIQGVENARALVAKLINARPSEIVMTSGATESNNLAIKGTVLSSDGTRNHIITQATEHRSVIDVCSRLERNGCSVTYLPVMSDGRIDLDDLRRAITPRTSLVSIMFANNEIGVIQPIAEVGRIAKEAGVLFHVDAVQAVGKIPLDVEACGIDILSVSAHKLYGPKGVGALYIRRSNPMLKLHPMINGDRSEQDLRAGSLNAAGVVGFGTACEICRLEMADESHRLGSLRDRLRDGILSQLEETRVNGSMEHRLPHNLHLSFLIEGQSRPISIQGLAISSGSACSSANPDPSHVLKALGVKDTLARTSVRFGLGRFNNKDEIEFAVDRVVDTIKNRRTLSRYSLDPVRQLAYAFTSAGRFLRSLMERPGPIPMKKAGTLRCPNKNDKRNLLT